MKTAYYMLTTQENVLPEGSLEQVSGGTPHVTWIRQPDRQQQKGGGKVIDLAAWKAGQEPLEDPAWPDGGEDAWYDEAPPVWPLEADPVPEQPVYRVRRDHSVLPLGELAATLSVIGAMAALMLRVLIF